MACWDMYATRCYNQKLVHNFAKKVLMERLASNLNYAKRVLSGQYKEFNPEVTIDELKNEVIPYQQKILDTLKAEHVSSKVLFDWFYEFICEGESKEIFGDYFYVSERNGLIYERARDVPHARARLSDPQGVRALLQVLRARGEGCRVLRRLAHREGPHSSQERPACEFWRVEACARLRRKRRRRRVRRQ